MRASKFASKKYVDFEIKKIRATVHLLINHNKGLKKHLSNKKSSDKHYRDRKLPSRVAKKVLAILNGTNRYKLADE